MKVFGYTVCIIMVNIDSKYPVVEEEEAEDESVKVGSEKREVEDHGT